MLNKLVRARKFEPLVSAPRTLRTPLYGLNLLYIISALIIATKVACALFSSSHSSYNKQALAQQPKLF